MKEAKEAGMNWCEMGEGGEKATRMKEEGGGVDLNELWPRW